MPTSDPILTPERILAATEDVIRRYGPAKATVADVARVLGVSPGSIYRHFPSKTALREAVTQDWLRRMHEGLSDIAERSDEPAADRLRSWMMTLHNAKRTHAAADREIFDTYSVLVNESSAVATEHVEDLIGQIEKIVRDGIDSGEFARRDAHVTARAVFTATLRYHDPLHVQDWADTDTEFSAVLDLVITGLSCLPLPAPWPFPA